jgi:hypothetical protein
MVEVMVVPLTFTGLGAGAHTIAVRDANGCVFSTTVTITSSGGPTAIDATPTDAACGANNGAITINDVTGGAAPYEYALDGGGYGNTTNFTGLGAGAYTIAVRDANGCVFSTTVTITSSGGPTAINATPTDATCGNNDGSININGVTGGNAPYEYSIDGGGYGSTTNFNSLSPGIHTITARDANGCLYSSSLTISSTECCPTGLNVTPSDASCGQDNGSLSIGNVTVALLLTLIPSMEATTATPLITLTLLPVLTL